MNNIGKLLKQTKRQRCDQGAENKQLFTKSAVNVDTGERSLKEQY